MMVQKVNVGLRIPSIHPIDVPALRRFILKAESLNFHSIWVGDHLFFKQDILHPLSALSWIASLTSNVRLGTAVMLTAYRDPVLLAKEAATLDYLSDGRVILGISVGGSEEEYSSLGVPVRERVPRLRENIDILRLLWQQDNASYEGQFHSVTNASITPKPVQKPTIPLWLGGHNEGVLIRSAETADGWIASAATTSEETNNDIAKICDLLMDQGRDPNTFDFGKLKAVSVDRNSAQALESAKRHLGTYYGSWFDVEKHAAYGTPSECAEKLRPLTMANVPEITLALEPSTLDESQLELIAETAELLK